LERDGNYYVFIEESLNRRGKGHISVFVIDSDGNVGEPVKVLEQPYHLAYPHVFEWNGDYFMVPDTSEAGTISLYRCTEFPLKWEFSCHLLEGVKAFDTTLLQRDGIWWMFTNMVENEGGSDWDELFLFHSEYLESKKWIAHPLNPIVSDVTNARPAGAIFGQGDHLYRPAQDCGRRYGYAFQINEIVTLNESDYSEKTIARTTPNWRSDLQGIHTFNSTGELTIIDGIVRRLKFELPWRKKTISIKDALRPIENSMLADNTFDSGRNR